MSKPKESSTRRRFPIGAAVSALIGFGLCVRGVTILRGVLSVTSWSEFAGKDPETIGWIVFGTAPLVLGCLCLSGSVWMLLQSGRPKTVL